MKNIISITKYLFIVMLIESCCKDDQIKPIALGEIKVDLNASKSLVRKNESLIGNLIADAMKADAESKEKRVDFAIMNGGGIRFNAETRPTGIYPAGLFTSGMIDEMLPFGNSNVIVQVTGKELKSIFERSVAALPLPQGPFLQVSKEIKILIDTTMEPQIIDELVEPNVIINDGERIRSIKINNIEYDPTNVYSLIVSDFIADGNDGYIMFKNIGQDKKEYLGEDQSGAVKEYIILNTPLIPLIEERITYE
jgi:5'-nucleotidase / UDP-sugar diphosphatase